MAIIHGFPGKVLPELTVSLLDVINQHATHSPAKECVYSIEFAGNQLVATGTCYADLIHQTLQVADIIKSQTKEGDRVLISIEQPVQFLIAFLATLSAKRIAVPAPWVDNFKNQSATIKRVNSICEDCQPSLFIMDNQEAWQATNFSSSQFISLDELNLTQQADSDSLKMLPKVELNEVAYLQYTSGSTSNPKGCIITHKNVIANLSAIGTIGEYTNLKNTVTWLPLYHDMGLIAILLSLYWELQHYLFTPRQFVTRPASWLNAISQYKVEVITTPTFGLDLVTHYVSDKQIKDIDLSSVKVTCIGAEPIPVKTLSQFVARFQPYGFNSKSLYPSYGMAECTVAATMPPYNRECVIDTIDRAMLITQGKAIAKDSESQDTVSFVSVGHAIPGHEVKIVNPDTGEPCLEREAGEILIKGPSVSPGYFNHDKHSGSWLKSGDIGYIANNELFVIDRLKDLIIIAGQNYYPSDIESSLMELPELEKTKIACFAMDGNLSTERLHIIVEVKRNFHIPSEDLTTLIKKQIHERYNIANTLVSIVPRGSLERTSSGKIVRYANKNLLELANRNQIAHANE